MKKRLISMMLSSILLLSLAACGQTSDNTPAGDEGSEEGGTIVLKCGHVLAEDSHFDFGVDKFAELVNEKSNGTIQIEVHTDGTLGQEREMMESLQLGNLDLALVSTAPISNFYPKMSVLDMPYLFDSKEHAYAVLDGEIGTQLFEELKNQGMVGLAYMENGFRNIFSTKEIRTPSDLQGTKIRIMENEIQTATFSELGAIVTNMASGEVYTGLQQGTIDAAENAICAYYSSAYYEVCKELSLTEHFYGATALLMSSAVYDSLTEEQQNILKEAAAEARDLQRADVAERESKYLTELQEEDGVTVHTDIDKEAFKSITDEIYAQFYDIVPEDLIESIRNCAY